MTAVDLPRPRLDSSVRMPDGRRIGVAEFGAPAGRPLLWFHGIPGGRHQVPPAVRSRAADFGVRVIAIERPGIGKSSKHLYKRIRDFAADVDVVLDSLGIDEFAVVGMSGGGAYAQAVAHQMPERVVSLALLCSVAPAIGDHKAPGGAVNDLARTFRVPMIYVRRPMGTVLWGVIQALKPVANPVFDFACDRMPESDGEIMRDPATRRMFLTDLVGNSRRQCQAVLNDATLMGRHWGFDIRDIRVPTRVWMGTEDRIVPPEHGRHLAAVIPDAELEVHEGAGHLAGFGYGEGVLAYVADRYGDADRRAEQALTLG